MLEIVQDLDALGHDVVGFLALDMDDETDTARVMLERAVVQAFILGQSWNHHGLFLAKSESLKHRKRSKTAATRPCPPFLRASRGEPAPKCFTCDLGSDWWCQPLIGKNKKNSGLVTFFFPRWGCLPQGLRFPQVTGIGAS
jgi:hypothetical protein